MMWKYRYHMAASAVPDGFILAGINIAHANHFFDDGKPNRNINTMSAAEIAKTVKAHADEIGERRRNSNGYKNLTHLNTVLGLGVDNALSSVEFQLGARLLMGWFDIGSVFGFDLTAFHAVRYEAWPSLRKSLPAWANSLTNWLTPNPCAAALYPNARFGVVKQAALVPTTPRLATVRITA